MNGILETYENSSMSLSCKGKIKIADNIISEVNFKGYPRTYGDGWTGFYKNAKIGDDISQDKINKILSYDGHFNVKSYFKKIEEVCS